ncbi:MAG: hypothetical protein WB611_21390 [Stellaceae bacterium]
MIAQRFHDSREAGRLLAAKVAAYADRPDVVVLALPRGGVPVAHEAADPLHVPLEVFVIRKLGVPGHEELAMGAIATGGRSVRRGAAFRQDPRGRIHPEWEAGGTARDIPLCGLIASLPD